MVNNFRTLLSSLVSAQKKEVLINTSWRTVTVVFDKFVRLVLVLSVANILEPNIFGQYSYLLSLISIAFTFTGWGMGVLLVRDLKLSKNRSEVFSNALVVKVCIIFLSVVAAMVISFTRSYQFILPSLFIVGTLSSSHVRDIFIGVFLGLQKIKYEFLVILSEDFLLLSGFFFWFIKKPSFLNLVILYTFAMFFSLFIAFLLSKKLVKFNRFSINKFRVRSLLKDGFPLSLFGITSYLFFSTDQIVLHLFRGDYETGVYSFSARIILALAAVPSLVNTVLLPYLSRYKSNKMVIIRIIKYGLGLLCLLSIFLITLVYSIGPYFIRWFKPQYVTALPLLKLSSLTLLFTFTVSILDFVMLTYNYQKQDFLLTLKAGICNLVLLFILVPKYGVYGVIIASMISQLLNLFLTGKYVLRILKKTDDTFLAT
jgi:O-antigen/teichoic acid export membrane protein